jgi:hypothetical protein
LSGRGSARGREYRIEKALEDPAAAGYFVALVEDCGLAWCDGALRLVEGGFDLVVPDDAEGCGGWLVAVADLDSHADGLCGFGDGDPIEAVGGERGGEKLIVGADFYLVGVGVDLQNVERVGTADAEALALAYREAVDAFVMTPEESGRGSFCSSR